MNWELREVGDIDCTMDDSDLYVVINRVVGLVTHKEHAMSVVRVRADLMQSARTNTPIADDEPIMSFQGTANNVRKHLLAFICRQFGMWTHGGGVPISREHASYIGYELHRAETDEHYVQD